MMDPTSSEETNPYKYNVTEGAGNKDEEDSYVISLDSEQAIKGPAYYYNKRAEIKEELITEKRSSYSYSYAGQEAVVKDHHNHKRNACPSDGRSTHAGYGYHHEPPPQPRKSDRKVGFKDPRAEWFRRPLSGDSFHTIADMYNATQDDNSNNNNDRVHPSQQREGLQRNSDIMEDGQNKETYHNYRSSQPNYNTHVLDSKSSEASVIDKEFDLDPSSYTVIKVDNDSVPDIQVYTAIPNKIREYVINGIPSKVYDPLPPPIPIRRRISSQTPEWDSYSSGGIAALQDQDNNIPGASSPPSPKNDGSVSGQQVIADLLTVSSQGESCTFPQTELVQEPEPEPATSSASGPTPGLGDTHSETTTAVPTGTTPTRTVTTRPFIEVTSASVGPSHNMSNNMFSVQSYEQTTTLQVLSVNLADNTITPVTTFPPPVPQPANNRQAERAVSHAPNMASIYSHHSRASQSVVDENTSELSLLSEDGNVLNSPASRHLISKFGQIVAKELLSSTSMNRKEEWDESGTDDFVIAVSTPDPSSKSSMSTTEQQQQQQVSQSSQGQGKSLERNPSKQESSKGETTTRKSASKSENKTEGNNNNKEDGKPKYLAEEIVDCKYAFSGCSEKLQKGTMYEQDHYLTCKYRPIKCLLAPACNEVLCHHNYIPHLMQHFLVPTYSNEIISNVVLTPEDFERGQTWTPKWFSAHDNHFFAIICRKENGTWSSWVWMLGNREEADRFAARITLYKGIKEVSRVFPVHSIRTEQEEIELERTCLLLNDESMIELTQVGKNIFSDFSLKVSLIPNAKELNNVTRENRALSRSRPLRSEKLYITTIDAME